MKQRKDWEVIHREFRTGLHSIRELGRRHNVSDTAIRKRATEEKWTRDLTHKVRERAEALVRAEEVRAGVRGQFGPAEKDVVESDALLIAAAEVRHRARTRRLDGIVDRLSLMLEQQAVNPEAMALIPDLVDLQAEDLTAQQKLQLLLMFKATAGMTGMVENTKKLAESSRTVIEMERKVLRIDADKQTTPIEDVIHQLDEAARA